MKKIVFYSFFLLKNIIPSDYLDLAKPDVLGYEPSKPIAISCKEKPWQLEKSTTKELSYNPETQEQHKIILAYFYPFAEQNAFRQRVCVGKLKVSQEIS